MRVVPASLVALALVAVALAVPGADAHAVPRTVDPVHGARLDASPQFLTVDFTEPPDPATTRFELLNATLHAFPLETVRVDGHTATATVPPLPPGGYAVKWSTVSLKDGHETRGSWGFAIGDTAAVPDALQVTESGVTGTVVMAKALATVTLVVAVGVLAFRALVPRPARALEDAWLAPCSRGAAVAHVGAAVALAVAHGAASGLALDAYFTGTAFGRGLVARAVLAGALATLLLLPRPSWRSAGAVAALALVAHSAFTHAAATFGSAWIGVSLHALHLAAVAAWAGGLPALAVLLWRRRRDGNGSPLVPGRVVDAFSRLATWSVIVVTMTGLVLADALAGRVPTLWLTSSYGQFLVVKLALVMLMIGLGGVNRFLHVPRRAFHALARTTTPEAALGVGVLVLAALLSSQGPVLAPHTAALEAASMGPGHVPDAPPFRLSEDARSFNFTITVSPAPALSELSNWSVRLVDRAENRAVEDAQRVIVYTEYVDEDVGRGEAAATHDGLGRYVLDGAFFTMPGTWRVTVEAVAQGLPADRVTFTVTV